MDTSGAAVAGRDYDIITLLDLDTHFAVQTGTRRMCSAGVCGYHYMQNRALFGKGSIFYLPK